MTGFVNIIKCVHHYFFKAGCLIIAIFKTTQPSATLLSH
jgi:hypothetical protein